MGNSVFKRLIIVPAAALLMLSLTTGGYASSGQSGTLNGKTMSPDAIVDAMEDADSGKSYELVMLSDWGIDDPIVIPQESTVVINMNGHRLYRSDIDPTDGDYESDGELIYMDTESNLTINGGDRSISHSVKVFQKNSSRKGSDASFSGGVISNGGSTNGGGAIQMDGDGCVLALNSVTLAGNRAEQRAGTDGHGGAIYVDNSNNKINLNNTTITGNWAYNNGGAIYCNSNAEIYMKNSHIDDNYAWDDGGAIYFDGNGNTLAGSGDCTISGNRAEANDPFHYGGGAIYVNADTSITGITFHGNRSDYDAGAIYADGDVFSVSECTFTDNTAGRHGGAIFLDDAYSGIFDKSQSISACIIKDNSSEKEGGGVFVDTDVNDNEDDEALSVTGKTVIKDNNGSSAASANLYLYDEDTTIDMDVTKDSDVHVGFKAPENNKRVSDHAGTYRIKFLTCDNSGFYFVWTDDRHIRLKSGSKPAPEPKTEVNPGAKSSGTYNNEYELVRGYTTFGDIEEDSRDSDVVFYYSDGFFFDKASEYNEHLATTSMNMSLAAMYLNAGGAGSTVDYKNKHAAIRQFLADIGCDDQSIYINDYNIVRPGTDSIGVAIASKELLNKDKSETGKILIPVAIRGGNYEAEWASNCTIGLSGEHAGFSDAADKVCREIDAYIEKYELEDELKAGNVKFWVAGFSRAGATANLTSKRLIDKYVGGDKYGRNEVFGYTFEAPQGGIDSAEIVGKDYGTIHNLLNYGDIVPLVAPSEMGLKRYGVDHYVPGGEAGNTTQKKNQASRAGGAGPVSVTTYSDNDIWYSDGDEYRKQRVKMLEQLNAVDSDMIFDDYFHVAHINYMPNLRILECDEGKDVKVNMEIWERDLIARLQKDAIQNRTIYSGSGPVINDKTYETIERSARELAGMVFAMDVDKASEFINRASTIMNHIGTGDKVSIVYGDMVGDWNTLSDKTKESHIKWMWGKLKDTGALDVLTEEEAAIVEKDFPTLLNMILQFQGPDYLDSGSDNLYKTDLASTLLGTSIYNMSRAISNHAHEVVLTWTRSYDSFYDNETKEIDISVPESVDAPKASAVSEESPDKPVVLDSDEEKLLIGNQKIVLDVDNTSGEAIYYTLKEGDTTIAKDAIYRGGISLSCTEGKLRDFTVTAYAIKYGVKSKAVEYDFDIQGTKHEVEVYAKWGNSVYRDEPYFYKEGDKATISAPDLDTAYFKRWESVSCSGKDITTEILGSGDDSQATNETVTITMPESSIGGKIPENYKLQFNARYGQKIKKLTAELDAPTADELLDKSASLKALLSDSVSEDSFSTESVVWTYQYAGKTVLNSSDKAYGETVYTAEILLKMNKDTGMVFSRDVEAAVSDEMPAGTNVDAAFNAADGSLLLKITYPETGEGSSRPENSRTLVIDTFDLNLQKKLPDSAEYYTESGDGEAARVTVTAPSVESEVFAGWDTEGTGITLENEDERTSQTATMVIPAGADVSKYTITANYIPVVQEFNIVLDAPETEKKMPDLKEVEVVFENTYGLDPEDFELVWTPEGETADYETNYTAKIKLAPKDADGKVHVIKVNGQSADQKVEGVFLYASNAKAKVNGEAAKLDESENAVVYTFPMTDSYKSLLLGIKNPDNVKGIPYGSGPDGIKAKLTDKTDIQVSDNSINSAAVEWDTPELITTGRETDPKTYRVTGRVVLPETVKNDNNINLGVEIEATVDGAPKTAAPVASHAAGRYQKDFNLVLSCPEENAVIYYTVDGSEPSEKSDVYQNAIPIRRADKLSDKDPTVSVRAIAVRNGKSISDELVQVYEFINIIDVPSAQQIEYDGSPKIGLPASEFYTLSAEDGSGVSIDENGNAVVSEVGIYSVRASINSGFKWNGGYSETGEQLTTEDDQIITIEVISAEQHFENLKEAVNDMELLVQDISSIGAEAPEGLVKAVEDARADFDVIDSDYAVGSRDKDLVKRCDNLMASVTDLKKQAVSEIQGRFRAVAAEAAENIATMENGGHDSAKVEKLKSALAQININIDALAEEERNISEKVADVALAVADFQDVLGKELNSFRDAEVGQLIQNQLNSDKLKPSALVTDKYRVTIKWTTPNANRSGFQLARVKSDGSNYIIKRTTDLRYVDKKVAARYRVREYQVYNGKTYYGKWQTATTKLKTTAVTYAKSPGVGRLKIKYRSVPKATSYRIYYKKSGSKARYKTVGKKYLSTTLKKLSRSRKYTVKVRAQYKGSSMKLYGNWSKARTVKTR